MSTMRAKMQVGHVQVHRNDAGETVQETVNMHAVAAPKYPADGSDEDNTYARFTPNATLSINIVNPALFGKFEHGQRYNLDFSPATA